MSRLIGVVFYQVVFTAAQHQRYASVDAFALVQHEVLVPGAGALAAEAAKVLTPLQQRALKLRKEATRRGSGKTFAQLSAERRESVAKGCATKGSAARSPAAWDPESLMDAVSMGDLMEIFSALNDAVKSNKMVKAFYATIDQVELSADAYARQAAALAHNLSQNLPKTPAENVSSLLATYFDDEMVAAEAHMKEANAAWTALQKKMPAALNTSFTTLLKTMTTRSPPLVDKAAFAATPVAELCAARVNPMLADVKMYDANLTKEQEIMNVTADMLPIMNTITPWMDNEVGILLNKLLDLEYVENVALKESSATILVNVTQVINDRLHCDFSRGARAGGSLLAITVYALLWALRP